MTAVPTIERADTTHAEILAGLARRTFIDAYSADNAPEHVHDYVASAFAVDTVRSELADPACTFLIARTAAGEIGYAKLRLESPIDGVDDPTAAELQRIYVDNTSRGGGIGRALLDAAIAAARRAGAGTLWLAVWEQNAGGQRFYARAGFEAVGRTFFMLGPERQEDLVLALPLY